MFDLAVCGNRVTILIQVRHGNWKVHMQKTTRFFNAKMIQIEFLKEIQCSLSPFTAIIGLCSGLSSFLPTGSGVDHEQKADDGLS
jgi:hypothetical protein